MGVLYTEVRYELKEGTKTVYVEVKRKTENVEMDVVNNVVNSAPFFRRLGGSETITRGYTKRGYLPIEVISKSPDRQTKVVRTFRYE